MSDALGQLKRNSNALRQAYADRGGTFQHRDHSPCIFCGDSSGFAFLDSTKDGLARWRCFAGKSDKCAARAGSNTAGTIVDLIARADGIDDSAAVKVALAAYAAEGGRRKAEGGERPEGRGQNAEGGQKRKGKLHLTPDLAFEAAKWGMMQRPGLVSAELVKVWKYCDEQGEPRIEVGRFNVSKGNKTGKEFAPIHRDGNGWRVGLGPYGKEKKAPLYRLPELLKALG